MGIRSTKGVIDGAGSAMLSASGSLALEGQSAIGVGGEQRFDIVSGNGLGPICRGKLQQTMRRPVGKQTENIAQITPGLDLV